MLTARDIKGVNALPATPCKAGAAGWDSTDSVDLEEATSMTEKFIRDGVGSIALCGTTGENAALLWEEKLKYVDTVVQVARKRVPIFAGVTALGTKEVIRQMKGIQEIGADGAFCGLPLWQTPTLENSVQFYADLSEAVPDMPVMIYSNAMFFKSNFPTAFWAGVAKKAPTVVATKVTYPINWLEDFRVAGHQINFLPGHGQAYLAYKILGRENVIGLWATGAAMGPEPLVALVDAIQRDDEAKAREIYEDMNSLPSFMPAGEREKFAQYNVQAEKARFNAAGYYNCGPSRAPYRDLPESWQKSAEVHGKAWAELRKKYQKVSEAAS